VGQIKIEDPLKNPSQQSPGFNVTNLDPVPMSQLKGKLVYSFKDSYTSASVSNQPILGGPTANTNNPLLTAGGSSNPDDLVYNTDNTSLGNALPLAGKKSQPCNNLSVYRNTQW